jgi:hypothetical protein
MKQVQKLSFGGAIMAAASLALFSIVVGVSGFAQSSKAAKPKRQYIQAMAQGTSTQLGRMVSVNIIIEEYSTPADQKALLEAFEQKGKEGLYNALDKMHSKGRLAITGTLGYDINYVREFPMPDGSRKIRLITNRLITFGEAWASTRSSDYNLSAAEIILSPAKGTSTGTLLPAMDIKLDKEKGIEIETYQNPWKLTNVMLRH